MSIGRKLAAYLFILFGVGVFVITLGMYWLHNDPIQAWPVVIGATFGFVGFYLLDPNGAEDGGGFIVNAAVRVIGTIRGDRRTGEQVIQVDHAKVEITKSGQNTNTVEIAPKTGEDPHG